uniref:Leucine-rich repeat protein n=1 Tax=Macrostomum lignano TaxID=282301 RepID=A0A1I8FEA1_9PLAT
PVGRLCRNALSRPASPPGQCRRHFNRLTSAVRLTTSADSSKCLTKKMLISCYASGAASQRGVIQCGSAVAAASRLATEVLLEWDHSVTRMFGSGSQAQLKVELSKPPDGLQLVLLDLSEEALCTAAQSLPDLLRLHSARASRPPAANGERASLIGSLVINAELLDGLPSLEQLAVSGNNITASPDEPLASYSVASAGQLRGLTVLASIHSADYSTPLLASLPAFNPSASGAATSSSCEPAPSLRYLYLSENNIRRLQSDCFKGLSSLQHLQLNVNGLARLQNNIFSLRQQANRLSNEGLRPAEQPAVAQSEVQRAQQLAEKRHVLPLGSLQTLWTDSPAVDCVKFKRRALVAARGLDRLMPNKSVKDAKVRAATASGDEADKTRYDERQPSRLTIVLLIVFSIVCLIHVLTTGVTL